MQTHTHTQNFYDFIYEMHQNRFWKRLFLKLIIKSWIYTSAALLSQNSVGMSGVWSLTVEMMFFCKLYCRQPFLILISRSSQRSVSITSDCSRPCVLYYHSLYIQIPHNLNKHTPRSYFYPPASKIQQPGLQKKRLPLPFHLRKYNCHCKVYFPACNQQRRN